MIVYRVSCKNEHSFDVWFKDSATCDAQIAARRVACPDCGTRQVAKALMAPRVKKSRPEAAPPANAEPTPAQVMAMLRELRRQVEANCENVGDRFADEARRIHNGEGAPRGIYGEASSEAAEALLDDGIEVHRLPWVPVHDA